MSLTDDAARLKVEVQEFMDAKVKVALFGRSGAGKSSVINRLTGQKLATVGVRTDTTREVGMYEWNGIILTDLPGYSTSLYSSAAYFNEFSILSEYDVFLCVFDNRIYEDDIAFYHELKKSGKISLFVRNKIDTLWSHDSDQMKEEMQDEIRLDLQSQMHEGEQPPLYFVSCRTGEGFDELQKAVFACLTDYKQQRYLISAKAYSREFLDKKKALADKVVGKFAGLAALNGINPIPGLDVAVDIGLLLKLFNDLKKGFGLEDGLLTKYQQVMNNPQQTAMIENIIKFVTKEGVISLIKSISKREGSKLIAKFIPFVGQAVAATAGYLITSNAGKRYVDDCYTVAQLILEQELAVRKEQQMSEEMS